MNKGTYDESVQSLKGQTETVPARKCSVLTCWPLNLKTGRVQTLKIQSERNSLRRYEAIEALHPLRAGSYWANQEEEVMPHAVSRSRLFGCAFTSLRAGPCWLFLRPRLLNSACTVPPFALIVNVTGRFRSALWLVLNLKGQSSIDCD